MITLKAPIPLWITRKLSGMIFLHHKWHVLVSYNSQCESNVRIPWLERVPYTKLLGVHGQLDQNLTWNEHVRSLFSSCYGTLSKLKRAFPLRKSIWKNWYFEKTDCACTVFHPLPLYQQIHLQWLQNSSAGFVLRKIELVNTTESYS